jgi:arginine-tRNA-protein transferase
VTATELSGLLATGWRKFGIYYFRPACPGCRACIPLRVDVKNFQPSRSQRRILRRGSLFSTRFGPLRLDDRSFRIYQEHAAARFSMMAPLEDFLLHFHLPSCPALQTEIFQGEDLIGVGFLDRGNDCLSSVYFCFDPAYGRFSLGTFGALQEIFQAAALGLDWYYLGYYIPGCSRMIYKDQFRPRQHYDWRRSAWGNVEDGLSDANKDEPDRRFPI